MGMLIDDKGVRGGKDMDKAQSTVVHGLDGSMGVVVSSYGSCL